MRGQRHQTHGCGDGRLMEFIITGISVASMGLAWGEGGDKRARMGLAWGEGGDKRARMGLAWGEGGDKRARMGLAWGEGGDKRARMGLACGEGGDKHGEGGDKRAGCAAIPRACRGRPLGDRPSTWDPSLNCLYPCSYTYLQPHPRPAGLSSRGAVALLVSSNYFGSIVGGEPLRFRVARSGLGFQGHGQGPVVVRSGMLRCRGHEEHRGHWGGLQGILLYLIQLTIAWPRAWP